MLNPFSAVLAAASALVTLAAASLYDRVFDDPAVRRAALAGYVKQAELETANAKLAEAQRQRNVAAQTLEEHRRRVAALEAEQARDRERREQERAEHEQALAAAGCDDGLTDADIRWLRRP